MNCMVKEPFSIKTSQGERTLLSGQVINLPDDKAMILIQRGKVSLADPEQQHTYQERAAIIEHDGGLDREEAERQAWCKSVCMLSYPAQWNECRRFHPKPCLKLHVGRS